MGKRTAKTTVPKAQPKSECLSRPAQAQATQLDLAFHTLGWRAFQDLCASVCEVLQRRPVEVYREACDGGQDAVFKSRSVDGAAPETIVQCKFSSSAQRSLKVSDLTRERDTIRELTKMGLARNYWLMTNMSVDGRTAIQLKKWLASQGVENPSVFGKEFLNQQVRQSSRLRSLVPRIYGLGDLSAILDERAAAQTRQMLGHMQQGLSVYVPTEPHLKAVRTLSQHKIVLLLGDPATGKSMIAAILATSASEGASHHCFKADGPEASLENWNADGTPALFWIDDAFGPNQIREDFVDRWIQLMPKILAATTEGNRFILTSRRHIYEAAKNKLGSRNHPLFRDGSAIVNVGTLAFEERRQILYNHVKAGDQPLWWKTAIKPHLDECAREVGFLPEIARRLADPKYTSGVAATRESLLRFIREPREHLIQVVRELSKVDLAALTLVFLHNGQMPVDIANPGMTALVETHFGVDRSSLGVAMNSLRDSFLVERIADDGSRIWGFKHPTIADAVSSILGETSGMVELYIRGTNPVTLLSTVACSGMPVERDMIRVPDHLGDLLSQRILLAPDTPAINSLLFSFLAERDSDEVLAKILSRDKSLLFRASTNYVPLIHHPKVRAHARAHRHGLLPSEARTETSEQLSDAVVNRLDTSFLDEDELLSVVEPRTLLHLKSRVLESLSEVVSAQVDDAENDASLDIDAEDNFYEIERSLSALRELFEDSVEALSVLDDAAQAIRDAIVRVGERKAILDREPEDDDWKWEEREPGTIASDPSRGAEPFDLPRSVFSDVDDAQG